MNWGFIQIKTIASCFSSWLLDLNQIWEFHVKNKLEINWFKWIKLNHCYSVIITNNTDFFLSILLFLLARYTNSFFYHFFRLLSFLFPVSNLTTFYEGSKRKRCSFDCFVLSLPSFFINILLSKRNAFFFSLSIFSQLKYLCFLFLSCLRTLEEFQKILRKKHSL